MSNSIENSNALSKEICLANCRWLQVCAGQDASVEVAIHAIYDIYQQDEVEGVHLANVENAFNSINRKAMLHNISTACPTISTFISNYYKALNSKEGTTLWDTIAMGAYASGVTPLIHFLLEYILVNKQ